MTTPLLKLHYTPKRVPLQMTQWHILRENEYGESYITISKDCKVFDFTNAILRHFSLEVMKGDLSDKDRLGIGHKTPEEFRILEEYCNSRNELLFNELIIERNLIKLKLPIDIDIVLVPRQNNLELGTKSELTETVREIFEQMFGKAAPPPAYYSNLPGQSSVQHPMAADPSSASSSPSSSSQEGLQVLSVAAGREGILRKRLADIDNSMQLLHNIRREIMDELANIESLAPQPPGGMSLKGMLCKLNMLI